jgi:Na+/melibiose symporter-like transporter
MLFYKLNEEKMAQIETELNQRRSAEQMKKEA